MRVRVAGEGRLTALRRRSSVWPLMFVSWVARHLDVPPSLVALACWLFVATRLGFILLTLVVLRLLRPIGSPAANFVDAWARYDATYYARLAFQGYARDRLYRTAFFPLQPLMTAIFAPLTGGNTYLASIVVANLACLAALVGIGALALDVSRAESPMGKPGQRETQARRAMLYLALFPLALFLFAGYAESLFLALAIWCIVALRRGGWWQAGVLGLLAAATRQMGLFLVLPFAAEYARQHGWRLRWLRADALWISLIPCGLLLFMGWLWLTVGDPLAFQHAESYWHHAFAPPWRSLFDALATMRSETSPVARYKDALDLAAVILFAVLIVLGARRLPLGLTVYSAAVWLLALSYPVASWPLQSDARYMLAAFPCFLTLARLGRGAWLHVAVLALFTVLLVITTQYFLRGALII